MNEPSIVHRIFVCAKRCRCCCSSHCVSQSRRPAEAGKCCFLPRVELVLKSFSIPPSFERPTDGTEGGKRTTRSEVSLWNFGSLIPFFRITMRRRRRHPSFCFSPSPRICWPCADRYLGWSRLKQPKSRRNFLRRENDDDGRRLRRLFKNTGSLSRLEFLSHFPIKWRKSFFKSAFYGFLKRSGRWLAFCLIF